MPKKTWAQVLPALALAYRQRLGRKLDKPFELLLLYDEIPEMLESISSDLSQEAKQEWRSCMKLLPQRCLPAVGLGTFNVFAKESSLCHREPIAFAYDRGCRMFDFFDPPDGGVLAVQNDIPRIGSELRGKDLSGTVLVSKPDVFSPSCTGLRAQFLELLVKLGLQDTQRGKPVIDLYMMHYPFLLTDKLEFVPAGEIDVVWKEMERLVDAGLVRCLGVCNFSKQQLNTLLKMCRIRPVVHQFEHHPFCQNRDMVEYCHSLGIACIASIPLAKGSVVQSKYFQHTNMTPAQCALRWNLQQGVSVIPGAQSESQILENLESAALSETIVDVPPLDSMISKMAVTFPKLYRYMVCDGIFTHKNGHMYCSTKATESQSAEVPKEKEDIAQQLGSIVSCLQIGEDLQDRRAKICKMLGAKGCWRDLSEMHVISLPAFEAFGKPQQLHRCLGARILYISFSFATTCHVDGKAHRAVLRAARRWGERNAIPDHDLMLWVGFCCLETDEEERERTLNALGLHIICCDGFVSIDVPGYWDQAWTSMEVTLADAANIPRYIFYTASECEESWSLEALEFDDLLRTQANPSDGMVDDTAQRSIIHMQLAIARAIQGRTMYGDMAEPSEVLEDFNPSQEHSLRQLRRALAERNSEAFLIARSACSTHGVPLESIGEVEQEAKTDSEGAGVNVTYILSEFTKMAQEVSGNSDPTFTELSQELFFKRRVGKGLLCPRDLKVNCSFLDTLQIRNRKKATHFVSWVWGYRLHTVRGCLQRWLATCRELDPGEMFVYMCFFCNNQWRMLIEKSSSGCSDLEVRFEKRLSDIGNLIALMDEWNDPVYTKRVWTIFEQYTAIKLNIKVQFALPEGPSKTLHEYLDQGRQGFNTVIAAIAKVDAESAEATFKEDEAKVKSMIRESEFGTAGVNAAVKHSIVRWVGREFKANFHELLRQSATQPVLDDASSKLCLSKMESRSEGPEFARDSSPELLRTASKLAL
eukprot:TRINITY_DN90647_c0_g1_i1.p1 TRINITY_DN90647_c0_g1~~TRINITY_DN90647_c0_g1_i1.p1  ORF type:complete len:1039 (-),score=140.37 TRINITY_DN90647_c0_g1_i1:16-2967(-)